MASWKDPAMPVKPASPSPSPAPTPFAQGDGRLPPHCRVLPTAAFNCGAVDGHRTLAPHPQPRSRQIPSRPPIAPAAPFAGTRLTGQLLFFRIMQSKIGGITVLPATKAHRLPVTCCHAVSRTGFHRHHGARCVWWRLRTMAARRRLYSVCNRPFTVACARGRASSVGIPFQPECCGSIHS